MAKAYNCEKRLVWEGGLIAIRVCCERSKSYKFMRKALEEAGLRRIDSITF